MSHERQRSPRRDRKETPQTAPPEATQATEEESSSGIMGWLESAGSWISETYDETTETVGHWLDVADEATHLDYDVGLEQISATGTLRDVIEVAVTAGQVDADLLKLLEGSTSDNTVTMTYNFIEGTLEVLAPELELVGFEAGGVSIARATLHGVRIAAESGSIGLTSEAGTRAEITADNLHAEGVSFVGGDGPVQVAEADIDGFAFRAASRGTELLDREGITAAFEAQAIAARHILGDGSELESADITGLSGSLDGAEESANVTLDELCAKGFTRGGIGLGDASVTGARIDVSNKGGGLPLLDQQPDHIAGGVNVAAAAITDFQHPMANVGAAILDQFSASYDQGGGATAGARSLTASDIESQWAEVESMSMNGMTAQSGGEDLQVELDEMTAHAITSDQATVGDLSTGALSASLTADQQSARIGNLRADAVETPFADIASVRAGGMEATHTDGAIDAGLANVRASGVDGSDFDADEMSVGNARARVAGEHVSGHIGSGSVKNLETFGATLGKASATDVDFAGVGDHADISIGTLSGEQAAYEDLISARSIDARGAKVGVRGNDIDASVEGVDLRKVAGEYVDSDALLARDVGVVIDESSTTAHLGSAAAFGSTIADRVGVDKAEISGLTTQLTDDRYHVEMDQAAMSGVRDRPTGTTVGAAELQGLKLDATEDATAADVRHLAMRDADFAMEGGGATEASSGPGVDIDALIRSASKRVDSADISARVGMNAGDYGPATIREGSELRADVGVRDNQFTKLNAEVTKGVDLPGWIEGNGAYLDDKGRLQADLGGFFDITAGGHINEALGIEGEKMPSVGRLGGAVASQMAKPATGDSEGPSPMNVDDHDVRARVGLSPGKLDAGLGSASLQRDRSSDNVVDVHSKGGQGLSVQAARLLAGSLSVNAGADVEAGRTAVDRPEMYRSDKGDLSASADGLSTRDLRVDPGIGAVSAGKADVRDARFHQSASGDMKGSVKSADVQNLKYRGAGMVIPGSSDAQGPTTGAATQHEVRRGDSLGAIARTYGTTIDALARANGITDPNKIFPGQRLQIP